jgi:hypothetical protein
MAFHVRHQAMFGTVVALLVAGATGCRSVGPTPAAPPPAAAAGNGRSEGSREMKFKIDRAASFELEGLALMLRNERIEGACSPVIEEGPGIAINAPAEVTFSTGAFLDPRDARFIVCGASQFVYDTLGFGSSFADHVSFVAVDARTHQSYAGVMEPNVPNAIPPPADLPRPTTDHSQSTIGEWFRTNLAAIMRLPAVETEYVVYAALGPHRSNTLTVKVVKRK